MVSKGHKSGILRFLCFYCPMGGEFHFLEGTILMGLENISCLLPLIAFLGLYSFQFPYVLML